MSQQLMADVTERQKAQSLETRGVQAKPDSVFVYKNKKKDDQDEKE